MRPFQVTELSLASDSNMLRRALAITASVAATVFFSASDSRIVAAQPRHVDECTAWAQLKHEFPLWPDDHIHARYNDPNPVPDPGSPYWEASPESDAYDVGDDGDTWHADWKLDYAVDHHEECPPNR